ncbi:c-type cytochrome, partial [candidate division KSB1 bacterium]|nr:c-type cytochrome [candidate division KSB1 bacterium]
VANEPLEVIGEKKFRQLACHTCHIDKPDARGPSLVGVFGEPVRLQNGRTVTVDETYIRESILNPNAKIAAGYRPVMPTFKGQIDEVGLLQITAYIKSLTKNK